MAGACGVAGCGQVQSSSLRKAPCSSTATRLSMPREVRRRVTRRGSSCRSTCIDNSLPCQNPFENPTSMKLATYKDGSRDGQLVVVSRDLTTAHYASGIATRLQQLLDDWNFVSPQLEDLYQTLNTGKARHGFEFEPGKCMAPLPRAYQWADGSAFINHVELVRKARNAEVPESFYTDPLMYQA